VSAGSIVVAMDVDVAVDVALAAAVGFR